VSLHGNILITGNGTLASAILRAAKAERWDATFTIFSRSESRLATTARRWKVRTVIGDVRDEHAVMAAVAGHDTVIHTAALKRIPECEAQPGECIATNVLGSLHVARACAHHGVRTAIAISTDKACRASTAYGASKLLMESLWRTFGGIAVRYGNVAASTGSVIPIWREQWNRGQPLTVTDHRMTRFWMSPADAVALIQCASEGQRGDVWVPKMGALPIARMAELICPGATIAETGLRSAEKLHEDLVAADEPALETTTHYVLRAGGTLGHAYTSRSAPPIDRTAFLEMLADASDLEAA
jgi:UDP-N-acetylglucosamine 4,6-dehydratase